LIYPANFEDISGFSALRQLLLNACRYPASQLLARNLGMSSDAAEIKSALDLNDEWARFCALYPGIAQSLDVQDISPLFGAMHIENFYFDEEELHMLYLAVDACRRIRKTVETQAEILPSLTKICGPDAELEPVEGIIRAVIDEKAQLLPYASAMYGKLRTEIDREEKQARQVVQSLFKTLKNAGMTAETDITVREDRLVIPLLAEHKKSLKGFVKDISATGKILYMEPAESLEINNRLVELYAARKRERENILRAVTNLLRPFADAMLQAMQVLARLDLLHAKYRLHSKLNAHRPVLKTGAELNLKNARNPLLWLKNESEKQPTVPISLRLDGQERIMVISGPNAGGKSLALKTTVLLQYMLQCGLFIPADPESECGVFEHIAIECGDGQSIADGLSTFSAHLTHIKSILGLASEELLFGIDEIGDGTDPRFGVPIARAVLDELLGSGARGVVTTHFGELKEWARTSDGAVNAGMAYDTVALKPLYKLQTGRPGSSFAIELLKKTGFEPGLVGAVETYAGALHTDTEALLVEIQGKKNELDALLTDNKQREQYLETMLAEYSKLKEKLESKRQDIYGEARKKAERLLQDANRQIELTIRSIREHGAEKNKTAQARKNLEEFEEKNILGEKKILSSSAEKIESRPKKKVPILPGTLVRSTMSEIPGEVLEVKKEKYLVVFGLLKMWLGENEITPVAEKEKTPQKRGVTGIDWVEKQLQFSPNLDVRGKNTEEAMQAVGKWLEEAYTLGQLKLKLVHGRGAGILRKALREKFRTLNYIKNWESESEQFGGDGATIIELM
jgi:DNA mismatch repair protein MutS2